MYETRNPSGFSKLFSSKKKNKYFLLIIDFSIKRRFNNHQVMDYINSFIDGHKVSNALLISVIFASFAIAFTQRHNLKISSIDSTAL